MNLKQFVTDAIRTESIIDDVVVNELLLTSTVQTLIAMGNVLDQIKKHVFYKKPYDLDTLRTHFLFASESLKTLATVTSDEILSDERTINVNPRLFHAVVGISTEATELLEALDLYDRNVDNTNLGEEWFDCCWYGSILLNELNIDWEDGLDAVIAKLKIRYPDKFESEKAINRDLKTERKVLEDGLNSNPPPSESA